MTGWLLAGAGGVVLLDQATKSLAVRFLSPAGEPDARHLGVFRLATNDGLWLGRAPAIPALVGLWAVTLACTVLVLIASAGSAAHGPAAAAGLVVALGGATGNLLDRLRRGAVVDFIALAWWPAFNLADVAIVAGVALAIGSVV